MFCIASHPFIFRNFPTSEHPVPIKSLGILPGASSYCILYPIVNHKEGSQFPGSPLISSFFTRRRQSGLLPFHLAQAYDIIFLRTFAVLFLLFLILCGLSLLRDDQQCDTADQDQSIGGESCYITSRGNF